MAEGSGAEFINRFDRKYEVTEPTAEGSISDNQIADKLSRIVIDARMPFELQDKVQLARAEKQFRVFVNRLNILPEEAFQQLILRIGDISTETIVDELQSMRRYFMGLGKQMPIDKNPKGKIPADLRTETEREK